MAGDREREKERELREWRERGGEGGSETVGNERQRERGGVGERRERGRRESRERNCTK